MDGAVIGMADGGAGRALALPRGARCALAAVFARRERASSGMAQGDGIEAKLEQLAERRRVAIRAAFAQLHSLALGCALGVTLGLAVLLATLALALRGGPKVGENLKALSSYFPGFTVDLAGCWVGGLYGFAAGFLAGWAVAGFRNLALRVVLAWARAAGDRWRRRHLLDEI